MKIESFSTYHFIKSLLARGIDLRFVSDAFSHGQGANVSVISFPDSQLNKVAESDLSYSIFEFMSGYLEPHDVCWTGDFEIVPKLNQGQLLFEIDLTSSNSNYWETYDPIYECVVVNVDATLDAILADIQSGSDLQADDLEFTCNLHIQSGTVARLCVRVRAPERTLSLDEEKAAQSVTLITEVEKRLFEAIRLSIDGHNSLVEGAGISEFEYELNIDSAPLSEGVGDYLDHSACYSTTLGDGELSAALGDDRSYVVDFPSR